MNIRFYNAKILTMEDNMDIFEGQIWIRDDIILYVGDAGDLDSFYKESGISCLVWDKEIDCKKNLLLPGFKNAHTHSGMTLLRSFADDLPLDAWLNKQVFPVEAKMSSEDIYDLTQLAILEYVSGGVTSIFDMYLTPESITVSCENAGMRCVQVGAVNNFSQSVELVEQMYQTLNHGNPLSSYILGFHAEYTCSEELLKEIAGLSKKYKAPVFTHNSETAAEVRGCIERHGTTPTVYLDSLSMFENGGGGYHCVHMSDEDIHIFKNKKLSVVTNPGSNTKLASGIAPITTFLKEGINVAIGTDGAASNNCLDMFREMFLVTGLAKLREQDASVVDAMDVLKMATVNGAKAMGLMNCDVLAKGKQADIIMIDLNQPNMQPLNNIGKNLVYSGSKENVIMTMIAGKILYDRGNYNIGIEPEIIYQKANAIIQRIRKSM